MNEPRTGSAGRSKTLQHPLRTETDLWLPAHQHHGLPALTTSTSSSRPHNDGREVLN